MNMKHWHTYEIIKGCQKDESSEKSQSPNSASNSYLYIYIISYLTDNNNCNVALRHITNVLKGKIWSDHRKITFTKADRGLIKGIFQLRGL